MNIGEKIKQLRDEKGLSQSELARRASTPDHKVNAQDINRIESGDTKNPSLSIVVAICTGLEEPITKLIGDVYNLDDPHPVEESSSPDMSETDRRRLKLLKLMQAQFQTGTEEEKQKYIEGAKLLFDSKRAEDFIKLLSEE